jgi:hypothetical protein
MSEILELPNNRRREAAGKERRLAAKLTVCPRHPQPRRKHAAAELLPGWPKRKTTRSGKEICGSMP